MLLLNNPNSLVIVVLLGVGALALLIASLTGGGKWRRAYEEERESNAVHVNDRESDLRDARWKLVELERDHAALQQRHAAAETTIAGLREELAAVRAAPTPPAAVALPAPAAVTPDPVAHEPVTVVAPEEPRDPLPIAAEPPPPSDPRPIASEPAPAADAVPIAAAAEAAAHPAPAEPAKSWFGTGKRDDLARIRGVGDVMNTRLFGLGVTSYHDIVHLSAEDEMALEQRLGIPAGLIARDQWREQAALLNAGNETEFADRFGNVDA